jgi:hypothetical protein
LLKRFPNLSEMKVVDLGGVERHWTHAPVRPKEVVLVNLPRESNASSMEVVVGDACEPPAELYDRRFDLVYSNSVIEHVGGHARQAAFAKAVRALGDHHWVQTPYRYFPIEPHWLFPGFQFLPVRARVLITPIWPLGTVERRIPAKRGRTCWSRPSQQDSDAIPLSSVGDLGGAGGRALEVPRGDR